MTDHHDSPVQDLVAHIGSTLRRQRDLHRLSQVDLASRAGVRQSTVPRIERGARGASVEMLGQAVREPRIEIALARSDCDAFIGWLSRRYGARWHDQYQEYGYAPLDPRLPGERRWRIIGSVVIRVDLVDELPESVEVRHGGRRYRDHAGFR